MQFKGGEGDGKDLFYGNCMSKLFVYHRISDRYSSIIIARGVNVTKKHVDNDLICYLSVNRDKSSEYYINVIRFR